MKQLAAIRFHWPAPRWTLAVVPGGLVLCGLMLGWILLVYPRLIVPGFTPAQVALAVLLDFLGAALVVTWFDTRPRRRPAARRAGIVAGAAAGVLWLIEIAFNNISRTSAATRLWADDSVWGLVAVVLLAVAVREARRDGLGAGVSAGLWSGTVSGLIACLAGLVLPVFFLPALLADPLNIAEYVARVPGGIPSMANYVAYETATGALGHLIVLGTVMGLLLGLIGAGIAAVLRRRSVA